MRILSFYIQITKKEKWHHCQLTQSVQAMTKVPPIVGSCKVLSQGRGMGGLGGHLDHTSLNELLDLRDGNQGCLLCVGPGGLESALPQ